MNKQLVLMSSGYPIAIANKVEDLFRLSYPAVKHITNLGEQSSIEEQLKVNDIINIEVVYKNTDVFEEHTVKYQVHVVHNYTK